MSNYKEGNDNNNSRELRQQYDRAKHNLAKALQNQSAEHRARVAEFVIDWQIDPNEEFFLIFAAIGHLKVLLEDAPSELRQAFDPLYAELDQWTNLTTAQLKSYNLQAETVNNLAQSCDRLGTISEALKLTSQQQQEQLKIFLAHLTDWKQDASKIPNLSKEITVLIRGLESFQDQLLLETKKLIAAVNSIRQNQSLRIGIWNFNSWGKIIGVGVVMFITAVMASVMTVNVFVSNPQPLSADTLSKISFIREHVDYNYTKLQRIEEALGIKPTKKQK